MRTRSVERCSVLIALVLLCASSLAQAQEYAAQTVATAPRSCRRPRGSSSLRDSRRRRFPAPAPVAIAPAPGKQIP